MAIEKLVLNDVSVMCDGVTLTTRAREVDINTTTNALDATAFGGNGWKSTIGGLKGGSVDFEFMNDVALIDAVIWPLLGTTVAVKVRPGGTAAIGTANPEYQFNCNVLQYQPVSGAVGDLATTSVSFPITGAVTRATA